MRDNCISLKYPPFDWKSQICNRDFQRKILKSNGNSKGVKSKLYRISDGYYKKWRKKV